ncbi:cytochrome P450 [Echria macrotheca]|uniref:Cytochrome P450 n=1 Tax=Echria macrotheca TaxID=438768 RepID=A0AAJ0BM02_9PEZI|nr:cytochrome P450 [Echria macrotheca]
MAILGLEGGSDWLTTPATLAVASLSTLYLVLYKLQTAKKHADEPPIIASGIPFVGHLLGMALHGGRYVKSIGLRHRGDKPIFTLPVPFSRIYVVTDPSLAAAVQRASRTLSFSPLIPDITARVLGFSAESVKLLRDKIDPEPGEEKGIIADLHDMVWAELGMGSDSLSEISLRSTREFARLVNEYVEAHDRDPEVVDLLVWIRHFVAVSTAAFLYGPGNPLSQDPSLEEAFWDFDHGLGGLLMGVFPSVSAKKALRGRERLVEAFRAYLERGGHKDPGASEIIRKRIEVLTSHGMSLAEAARSEVSFLFAGIVNTATTTFWLIVQLYSRPDLLAYIRAELLAGAVTELDMGGGDEKPTRLMDQEALKTNCPTLASAFKETLRLGSDFYSTRLVKADTTLSGKYFLAKDAVVQIAGGVIHEDPGIWGASVDKFDPMRFLKLERGDSSSSSSSNNGTIPITEEKQETKTANGQQKDGKTNIHPAAFRAFGGGKTLCPGRHFATHEILAFVGMLVLTVDLEPADGSKKIVVPEKEDGVMPVHILEPKTDVRVKVRVRKDGGRIVVVR